ncbi:hypothetical protein OPV22_025922 [Ensete ventricosum]|uniref:Uncharacterized protein n=1 Tax=Ensete ventricosum TaxID=4639 RepID=A0AAV8QEE0_ENSVE|nr:hypothetical protein OPV22_025922 [Ensete ventricosum]
MKPMTLVCRNCRRWQSRQGSGERKGQPPAAIKSKRAQRPAEERKPFSAFLNLHAFACCLWDDLLAERDAGVKWPMQLEELGRELAEEIRCRRRAEKRLKHALKKLESLKLAEERSYSSSKCSAMVNSGQCGPPEEVKGKAGDVAGKLVSQVQGRCSLAGTVQEDHVDEDEPEFRSQELSTDASRTSCGDSKKEASTDEGSKEERVVALIPGCRQQPEAEAPKLQNKEDVHHHVLAALRNVKELLLFSVGNES